MGKAGGPVAHPLEALILVIESMHQMAICKQAAQDSIWFPQKENRDVRSVCGPGDQTHKRHRRLIVGCHNLPQHPQPWPQRAAEQQLGKYSVGSQVRQMTACLNLSAGVALRGVCSYLHATYL
jgi:hypothetical protein